MFAVTDRLLLRPGWPEDAPALAAAIGHWPVARNLARLPWPYGVDDARNFLAAEREAPDISCVVLRRGGARPTLIGGVGLHPDASGALELGYWLTPAAWGRGYATEAAGALVAAARDSLGLDRLVSGHFEDNPGSGRVLAKLGFRVVGRAPRHCLAEGAARPAIDLALDLRADMRARPEVLAA